MKQMYKNIKKLSLSIVSLMIIGFSLSCCDIIEEPFLEKPIDVTDTTKVLRKVFLEDYTGHRCNNCPQAAKIAHDLQSLYGERLVVMAVHAGVFAQTPGGIWTYDFTTAAGDDFNSTFGFTAYPSGMVNRKKVNGSVIIGKDDWGSQVDQLLQLDADADITVELDFNATSRELKVDIETEFLNQLNGNYKLAVYLIESGIIKPQRNSDPSLGTVPDILDYEHNHVLRADINSIWGEDISSNTDSKSYNITLDSEWNESNCAVVTFIYRSDDGDGSQYEIVQAEEEHL